MFVWGFPCLRTGVDLAIGLTAESGIPLPWLRSRRCTRLTFAGPLPRHGSLKKVPNVPLASLEFPPYLAAARAVVTSRPIAQMKAANSRATAVMAAFLCLPFLSSAR